MRFFSNLLAWLAAAAVGYVFASAFSTNVVLSDLAALGAPVTLADRAEATLQDILGTYQYFAVFLVAYLIAFYIASLVKSWLPLLARVAYPVAGAAAIALALTLMELNYDVIPIGGGRSSFGFLLQALAGAIGGIAFELLRPRND